VSGLDGFWAHIKGQVDRMASAATADDVIRILGGKCSYSSGEAFFAGGDGNEMYGALFAAGWRIVWFEAPYYWCMSAPDASMISYVEGDVYRGDAKPKPVRL
jgi:hypothetical protein